MLIRWLKRGFWTLLLLALILTPAKLAQGPSTVQAAPDPAARAVPFQHPSLPTTALLATLPPLALILLSRRHHRHA